MAQWKEVPGYEELYLISDSGNIVGFKRGQQIPAIDSYGYLRTALCKAGSMKSFYVHRLVALAFIPNPNNKPTVNHKDEDKTNNFVNNLEWATEYEQNSFGTRTERSLTTRKSLLHSGGAPKKRVLQFTSNGEFIHEWNSIQEAAIGVCIAKHGISHCCHGTQHKAAGYVWRFKNQ
jgi:hypothetical protein